jgi:hypothetical protein
MRKILPSKRYQKPATKIIFVEAENIELGRKKISQHILACKRKGMKDAVL